MGEFGLVVDDDLIALGYAVADESDEIRQCVKNVDAELTRLRAELAEAKGGKRPRLTLVHGTEEWSGLYVDGRLERAASMLGADLVLGDLRAMGVVELDIREVQQQWLDGRGGFPGTLDQLPAAAPIGEAESDGR